MTELTLADVTIAYDEFGPADGAPVVLIGGCGQPALAWQVGVVPALVAAGFRVITFDNRGVAPSSSPPAPYSVDQMAGDTLALLDHLQIATAHVVGHSLGGWIAETIAARHPERVRTAAFLGSCNTPTAWEKAITTVERDLARLDYDLPPLFYATETLRYLPNQDLQDTELVDTWLSLIGDQEPWPNPGPARPVRSVPRVVDRSRARRRVAVHLGAVPHHGIRARHRLATGLRARSGRGHPRRALRRARRLEPPRAVHARSRGRRAPRRLPFRRVDHARERPDR